MAAFSWIQKHHPFLHHIDHFLPNSPNTIPNDINIYSSLLLHHEPNDINANSTPASSSHQLIYQSGNQITNNQEVSVRLSHGTHDKINSLDSASIVIDKFDSSRSELATHKLIIPMDKKRRYCSSANSAQSKDKRGEVITGKKQKKTRDGEEEKSAEEAPTGYIHVRARRGQATDSHSLAERVRREKISERMKLLQALVPGCDKVTGKALMLDEIINYVQSLQNQVEFLSMKLASVNPIFYDFGMDLETFMIRPDQDLSNLASPLPSMQESSPTTANNYHIQENSPNSILFQQAQLPNVLPQQHQVVWSLD